MSYNRLMHAIAYLETKMNEMISEGRVYYQDDEEFSALSTLHEIAMKQVPRPVDIIVTGDGMCYKWKRYYCPVCRKEQPNRIVNRELTCDKCGQRLTLEENK